MEISKSNELYKKLKKELNDEQQQNLFELICEYEEDEMKSTENNFKKGEKQGLKTALRLIIDAI